ncbi:nana2-like1 [Zea mays]|uniref:Delta(24)-sterol reductase n=1 Tax=Zea mays TaxID=4577 RepID=A0A1D6QA56_MAIZE|nr:nana2-like1 [Zea mays]
MRNVDYKRARRFEVDLSALRNILEIDAERMVARVEPLVSMAQITKATCPMNLSLAVAPELDDLTVGGLINGYGISGSSHVYGLFSDTVVSMEVVLADGQVVRATMDNEHSDLFYGMPWSQGTIGLLVSAEIRLVRVKEYMRLTYTPVRGTLKEIAEAYADSLFLPAKVPDFVEGMVYSSSEGVMMTGVYASEQEARRTKGSGRIINRVGWWFKPWFYQHAETALERGEFVEYIPTREYYHRHTRSLYWEGKLIIPFGDQLWLSDALEFAHRELEVYPVWLCPHRLFKLPVKTMVRPEPGFEQHRRKGDTSYAQMFTDVGFYYAPAPVLRGEDFDGAQAVHRLEQWVISNHGYQAQYAVSELSGKDFWRMFDASHYHHCRRKYGAVGTFMSAHYKSKKGKKTQEEIPLARETSQEASSSSAAER